MSTSMISTVLEIEREAEAVLTQARQEAETIAADAIIQRQAATKASEDAIRQEIADLEARAGAERATKVQELTVTGEAGLSAVRNISAAAFAGGVQYVMKKLTGKE